MLYVAYGSNMNIGQMEHRCPQSKVIGNGKMNGWKLIFNIHADIIQTNNKEDEVPVVIWDIHDEDWRMLDIYEGFPSYYTKEIVEVITDNGEKVHAIVYIMTEERKGICLPFKTYYDTVKQGYMDNGIDLEYLYNALLYTKKNKTEQNQYTIDKKKSINKPNNHYKPTYNTSRKKGSACHGAYRKKNVAR